MSSCNVNVNAEAIVKLIGRVIQFVVKLQLPYSHIHQAVQVTLIQELKEISPVACNCLEFIQKVPVYQVHQIKFKVLQ